MYFTKKFMWIAFAFTEAICGQSIHKSIHTRKDDRPRRDSHHSCVQLSELFSIFNFFAHVKQLDQPAELKACTREPDCLLCVLVCLFVCVLVCMYVC